MRSRTGSRATRTGCPPTRPRRRTVAGADERFVTLDRGQPEQGAASFQITLEPGTYTIEGYELSAADSSVQHLDNHTFTVR